MYMLVDTQEITELTFSHIIDLHQTILYLTIFQLMEILILILENKAQFTTQKSLEEIMDHMEIPISQIEMESCSEITDNNYLFSQF